MLAWRFGLCNVLRVDHFAESQKKTQRDLRIRVPEGHHELILRDERALGTEGGP